MKAFACLLFEVFDLVYEGLQAGLECWVLLAVVTDADDGHCPAVGAYLPGYGGYDIRGHTGKGTDTDGAGGAVMVHLDHFSDAEDGFALERFVYVGSGEFDNVSDITFGEWTEIFFEGFCELFFNLVLKIIFN